MNYDITDKYAYISDYLATISISHDTMVLFSDADEAISYFRNSYKATEWEDVAIKLSKEFRDSWKDFPDENDRIKAFLKLGGINASDEAVRKFIPQNFYIASGCKD